MPLECCYFCGFADDTALSEHHIIPKRIQKQTDDRTVTVCRNCHKKVHDLIDPIVDEFVEFENEPNEIVSKEEEWGAEAVMAVKDIHRKTGELVPIEDVKSNIESEVGDVDEAIYQAKFSGDIYEPKSGFVRPV